MKKKTSQALEPRLSLIEGLARDTQVAREVPQLHLSLVIVLCLGILFLSQTPHLHAASTEALKGAPQHEPDENVGRG